MTQLTSFTIGGITATLESNDRLGQTWRLSARRESDLGTTGKVFGIGTTYVSPTKQIGFSPNHLRTIAEIVERIDGMEAQP